MNMKLFLGVLVIVLGAFGLFLFSTQKKAEAPVVACPADAKECPDGSFVGRVGPRCEFAPCQTPSKEIEATSSEPLIINTPKPNSFVTSPVSVSGAARGSWFFEGSAPVAITDAHGNTIGEGHITAQRDWMTTDFVPFTGTITYTVNPKTTDDTGFIVFKRDNPSGLPENDASQKLPVRFSEFGTPGSAASDQGLGEGE